MQILDNVSKTQENPRNSWDIQVLDKFEDFTILQ